MDLLVVLGPPSVDEPGYVALRFSGDRLARPALDSTPEAAARRLFKEGERVALHPHNAVLAASLGLQTQEPTKAQRQALGHFAFSFDTGPALQKITDFDLLDELLEAIKELESVKAWERFDPMTGMATHIKGALSQWEVMVLGEGGIQKGFVLQPPGNAARMAELAGEKEAGRELASSDSIVVYLEDEPPWRKSLLAASHGLAHWPAISRLNKGRHAVLRPDEARLLVAAIRATTEVAKSGEAGTGHCEHRGKRVEVTVEPGDAWRLPLPAHPASAFDRRMTAKLLAYAEDLPGFSDAWRLEGDLALAPEIATALSLYHRPLEGKTIARRAWEAGLLIEIEQRWVEVQEDIPTSLVEVEALSVAEAAVVDLLSGEPHLLFDRTLAEGLTLREGLLVRMLDWGECMVPVGAWPGMLTPNQSRKLRDAFISEGGEALPEPERTSALLRLLQDVAGEDPEAGVKTTDGDPAELVLERFAVQSGSITEGLEVIPDLLPMGGGSYTWTKRGNSMHPDWWRTVLGTIQVHGRTIEVVTNAVRRADAFAALLREAFGSHIESVSRKTEPLPVPPGVSITIDSEPVLDGPWLDLMPQLQVLRQALDLLADGPTPERVDEIHEELCTLEFNHDADEQNLPDLLDLRRVIGIDARGKWVGPDEAFTAFGGDIPLSTLLPGLGAHVQNELDIEMEAFIELLVRLWNESREEKAGGEVLDRVLAGRHDAARLRGPFGWMLEQLQSTHAWDKRVIRKWRLDEGEDGYHLIAAATVDTSAFAPGGEPLRAYDAATPPPAKQWQQTPDPWRWHLVATYIRDHFNFFENDYDLLVKRVVEIEDALARGTPRVVVEAASALEEESSRVDAVFDIAGHLIGHPKVKVGTRTTPTLRRLMDELLETED